MSWLLRGPELQVSSLLLVPGHDVFCLRTTLGCSWICLQGVPCWCHAMVYACGEEHLHAKYVRS